MLTVNDLRDHFFDELASQRYTIDKTGFRTIEMLGASFLADEPAIFGVPSEEYIESEIKWYESMSTNINDIHKDKEPPAAWRYSANEHGEINSNYGHLLFSSKYFNQFKNALQELIDNPDTRRAQMVYNRPSIWVEFDENGKNDFICTNAQTFYIRDGKLHMVSQMRSNDVIFGYKNDYAWARYLQRRMIDNLVFMGKLPKLEVGNLYWQVMNLHVYEKHFHLVK